MPNSNTSPPLTDVSRRRFGTLVMGSGAYLLTGGCARPIALRGAAAAHPDGLLRSTPEEQGVSSAAILAFLAEVEAAGLELHGMMLMRNRHVVAEGWWWPYRAERVHITHSLTKSVTACAVGLAIDEGRFGLDDKVAGFFPQYLPADASANQRAMTVHDLLTMQTGQVVETSGSVWRPIETSWVAEFFKIPVPEQPGTRFLYTSAASYMLSAIVTKTTGRPMAEYLRPRLFEPLGIDNWRWDTSPGGISPGANGLTWTTAASLKLGDLHAQAGMWNGHRVLSDAWVRAATTKQVANKDDGYGYQWWMGPGGSYYALGLFTQLAIVFPAANATLAIFAAIDKSSRLKPFIWKHFPAAFGPAPLPRNPAATALAAKTASLRLLPPLAPTNAPGSGARSGRYVVEANDQGVRWVSFDFSASACDYRMADDHGEHRIAAGLIDYVEQDTTMTGNRLHHEYRPATMRVVAGARWRDADTLEMTWQFVESAFRDTVVCRFRGDAVSIDRSVNVNSSEMSLPTLRAARTT